NLLFAMVLSTSAISAAKAADGGIREKVLTINDVYIPSGFDSGSDAFVVVNGLFFNSCYSLKTAKVNHIGPLLHEVSTIANVREGMCLGGITPWHREVQLGKLVVGDHKIHFLNGDGTYMEKHLAIEN
ncbi:MAG: hypothetical protein ACXWSC_06605, partial [Bdellovibrionota bacterium]